MPTRDACTQVTAVKQRYTHKPYNTKYMEKDISSTLPTTFACQTETDESDRSSQSDTTQQFLPQNGGFAHSNSSDDVHIPIVQAPNSYMAQPKYGNPSFPASVALKPVFVSPVPNNTPSSTFNSNCSSMGSKNKSLQPISYGGKPTVMSANADELQSAIGVMPTLARTAQGSSFLQAALRSDPQNSFSLIFTELYPHFVELLMDDHGCYVVRVLLELLPLNDSAVILSEFANNEALWVNLATRSLHSRRMIQFVVEHFPDQWQFLLPIVQRHFHTICLSNQGCISIQRVLDGCTHPEREVLFNLVRASLVLFMEDQCGSYVVQYMLQHGDPMANLAAFQSHCGGRFLSLACSKYVSSLFEKAIQSLGSAFHSLLLAECEQLGDGQFCAVLNDGYGNYVIQALITNANLDVLISLNNRVQRLLPYIVYGAKLSQRMSQRMLHLRRKSGRA